MALAWEDRLKEAAYSGPDGTRIVFAFQDVSTVLRKKTKAHEFPDVDDTYVEDKGLKGSLYPLRIFFSGENHDLEADAFMAVLAQRGAGVLEHPMYGTRTAIPFGDIVRRDALVSASNQTVITVTFWETIVALYPAADEDTLQLVDDAVDSYDEGGATQFADSLEISKPGENAEFRANMKKLKDGALAGLQAAKDGTAKLQNGINRIDKAINSTLDAFIGDPATLLFQLRQMLNAPARSLASLRARLDGFKNLAESIFAGNGTDKGGGTGSSSSGAGEGIVDPGTGTPGAIAEANNLFHANRGVAELLVLSIALAVSGETYRTRQQALAAAEELAEVFDDLVTWSEDNYEALFTATTGPDASRPNSTGVGAIDTGEARQVMLEAVTRTMSYLVTVSFTLGVEKTIVLSTPRTAVDLVSELYGGIERLDEFIDTNDFTGSQILELPAGTLVRFYAE